MNREEEEEIPDWELEEIASSECGQIVAGTLSSFAACILLVSGAVIIAPQKIHHTHIQHSKQVRK